MERRFLYPWEKTFVIVCPECGGRIETRPLWSWEKRDDKLKKLQRWFCHVIGSEFLEKIPVLTEVDWKSKQRWDAFQKNLADDFRREKTGRGPQDVFKIENGVTKISVEYLRDLFSKYGIFALIHFFNKTELEMLFQFLDFEPDKWLYQVLFRRTMGISRSYVSTILKRLLGWRLIGAWKTSVKGRARGRQLVYTLTDEAREILEQDLRNHDFFRDAVLETVGPIADRFPKYSWRKDLLKTGE